jgi:hypothetical protein
MMKPGLYRYAGYCSTYLLVAMHAYELQALVLGIMEILALRKGIRDVLMSFGDIILLSGCR